MVNQSCFFGMCNSTTKGTKKIAVGTNMRNLQVSEGDKGRDVEVVDIHGAGGDVRGHGLEVLE